MSDNGNLVEQFFGSEVADALVDPAAVAAHRRREILRRIDEIIEILLPLDEEWQILMSNAFGVLAWGGMVIRGWNDRDGAERWRHVREIYEEMDDEDLLALEFEA